MSTLMKETQALTPKKAVQAHVSVYPRYSQSSQCTGNPSNAYVVNSGDCYGVLTHGHSSAAIKVECASDSLNSPWTAELSDGLFGLDREPKTFSGGGGNDNSCTSCIYDSARKQSFAINCGASACVPKPEVYVSLFLDTCSGGSFNHFIKANKCTEILYPIHGYVNVTCDEFTDASSWQMSTFADSDCSSPPAEVIHGTDANSCQVVAQVGTFYTMSSTHATVNCAGQSPSKLPSPVPTGAVPEGFLTLFHTPDTCTTGPQVGLFVPLDTCVNLGINPYGPDNPYGNYVRFSCSSADADAAWTMETFDTSDCDSDYTIKRTERIGACDCTPLIAYTDNDDPNNSYSLALSFNCGGNVPVSCAQAPTKVPTAMPTVNTTTFAEVALFSSDKTDSAIVSVQLDECVPLSEQGPYVKMSCLAANSDSWWSMTIYDNKFCIFSPSHPVMTNVNDIGACINRAFPWELEYNNFTVASLSVDCGNAVTPVTCASPAVATTTMSPSTVGGIAGGALAIVLVAVLLGLWMFGAVGLGAASMTVTSAPTPDASAQQVEKIDEASGVVSETAEETSNPINNSV